MKSAFGLFILFATLLHTGSSVENNLFAPIAFTPSPLLDPENVRKFFANFWTSRRSREHKGSNNSTIDEEKGIALDNSTFSSNSSILDLDAEIEKIEATCLTNQELKELTGFNLKSDYNKMIGNNLAKTAVKMIGLAELRSVLGFKPAGNWTKHGNPSSEEIADASTIEEYYELKEPHERDRSLDNYYFYESNFQSVIAFLNKRFPIIRKLYRNRYEEFLRKNADGKIRRSTINGILEEYGEVEIKLEIAVPRTFQSWDCENDFD